jgi:hypothetical protein
MSRIEFEHLSTNERLDLIDARREVLADETFPLTAAQIEESDRRADMADADLEVSVSWQAMYAEALRRYR